MSINLLPLQEKKELQLAELQKKVFVIFVFLAIFLLILILILSVLGSFISSRAGYFRGLVLEKEEELKATQFQGFKKIIEKSNQDLSSIQNLWQEEIFITSFFEKISSLTPSSIYFQSLSFQKTIQGGTAMADIRISGFAPTRETLFSFRGILEEDKAFQNIYFPPSSWVRPTNIDFSLNCKYTPVPEGN